MRTSREHVCYGWSGLCREAATIGGEHVVASLFLKARKTRNKDATRFASFVPSIRLDPAAAIVQKVSVTPKSIILAHKSSNRP
jgi:hypothetical protein